ncbi:MAG: CPBP family intramembrane glutamic endopeptidase [Dethiobacteria bacterium]
MQLLKLARSNHFVALMLILGIVLILLLGIILIITYNPAALGFPPPSYNTNKIYQFEPWHFSVGELEVSFDQGGIVVPLFSRYNRQEGVVLLGNGHYRGGGAGLEEGFAPAGLFLIIDPDHLEQLRGDIIFMPVEDEEIREATEKILAQQPGLPAIWSRTIPLAFSPEEGSFYYHFISEEGEPLFPPTQPVKRTTLFSALLLYLLVFILIMLIIYAFSLDYSPSRYWESLLETPPRATTLVAVPLVLALAFAGEMLSLLERWPGWFAGVVYLFTVLLLLLPARLGYMEYPDLGVRRETLRNGYVIAVFAAAVLTAATMYRPAAGSPPDPAALAALILAGLVTALGRELVWHGFIQTTLVRKLGTVWGFLATVVLVGLLHLACLASFQPWLLSYPFGWLELLLEPGLAAVLGFLYLRTENILSCTLLHAWILLLPQIW